MVTLEVGIDAAGLVRGSRDAMSALNALNNSVQHLTTGLEAIGAAGGGFGKFAGLLSKAQPWLMVVTTALAGISAGMQLFSRRTEEAASSWTKLNEAMAKATASDQVSRILGEQPNSGPARMSALRQAMESAPSSMGIQEYMASSGMSRMDIVRFLAQSGDTRAAQYLKTGGAPMHPMFPQSAIDPSTFVLSQQQQRELMARQFQSIQSVGAMSPGDAMKGRGFGDGMSGEGWPEGTGESQNMLAGRSWGSFDTTKQTKQAQREDQQRTLEAMREIEQRSQRIGDYMGDAATRFLLGISSARDLLREVATDLLRMGLSSGFANIAKGFMATPTQAAG